MTPIQEKRTSPRITTIVPVKCKVTQHGPAVLPSQRESHGGGKGFDARTVNVSRDGLLINCDCDLMPRTQLEVTLGAPTDGHPVKIAAEVAWSRKNAMNLFGRYSAGLKIRKMPVKDLAILLDFFKPV